VTDARDELVARVRRNLDEVRERIASSGRDPATVTIVAVTKTFGPDAVRAAAAAGLEDVAESYAQELLATRGATGALGLTWHFLGELQRNKLAKLAPLVDVYQSVDSGTRAAAVAQRAPGARCYVEVNVSGAPQRAGCEPGDVAEVVASARDAGLLVQGLMCVASPDPRRAAAQFEAVRRAADGLGLEGCSMGMSGDYELACAHGTTMLRLGTALLGARRRDQPSGLA
jgi:pyridoxal phosphate enzyme (YggS family)